MDFLIYNNQTFDIYKLPLYHARFLLHTTHTHPSLYFITQLVHLVCFIFIVPVTLLTIASTYTLYISIYDINIQIYKNKKKSCYIIIVFYNY
ncbi:hypothetical protein BDA99DRAFT_514471 [Phascolomyces articulosus]|uniref:Uncharacterized protein n=1 Tax=Phascolomyces articulosus TaxID=60185 RepID=A0AAD5PCG2_9FUNG|nr:hypothetical protein BDA99DRAFT_514471 [Phascolomyces articulosus]